MKTIGFVALANLLLTSQAISQRGHLKNQNHQWFWDSWFKKQEKPKKEVNPAGLWKIWQPKASHCEQSCVNQKGTVCGVTQRQCCPSTSKCQWSLSGQVCANNKRLTTEINCDIVLPTNVQNGTANSKPAVQTIQKQSQNKKQQTSETVNNNKKPAAQPLPI